MTDQPELTEDEKLQEQAKTDLETPPEPVPDAATLPDDVPSESIAEDDGSTVEHGEGE